MESPQGQIPKLQLQSPAVDFIENSLDKYHPAFSTPPSRYDHYIGGFVIQNPPDMMSARPAPAMIVAMHDDSPAPVTALAVPAEPSPTPESAAANPSHPLPQPVQSLEFWDSLFPRAMALLIEAHPDEPEYLMKSSQRLRDKTNWTQVFDQIELAKDDYSKVDKSFKAGFRKVHRKFGDHFAEPFNRMTKLVPAGGDLGTAAVTPIIGCVQILLEASRAASHIRKKMVGAFGEVDNMFANIELFLQIYPGDRNIEKASIRLIAGTLFAAENVIGFFLKGTGRKFLAAAAKRENYEQSTVESLNDITLQCEQLLQEAEKTHKYQVVNNINILMDTSVATHAEVQRIRREQVRPHDLRNIVHELLDELDRRTILQIRREEQLGRRIANLCLAAADAPLQSSTPALLTYAQAAPAPTPSVRHILTPNELLTCIGIPEILAKDLQHLAEKRKIQVSTQEQARAEQLIRTSEIREWLTGPTSSQLLVHGNYDRRAYISGLSLFCMSLTHTLAERAPRFIPLTFFCGIHTEPLRDAHTGGRALIQSFIHQLLCQFDFNSGSIPMAPEALDGVQQGDLGALCRLFELLVHMLPNTVALFCLVDGVVYYERDEFRDDLERVLMTILQLSDQAGAQAPVKVLLTSPTRTAVVRQPFPDDLILSMEGMARADLVASSSRLGREMSFGLD
ncbi:hypothetical protein Daus18300_010262 [Diaporthe australafricana]|uniref:Nephrocystin 3-like N-terminal domain-containing protein n=1 Tax=Diaporthe australafricana TaxID=127596 RepID=A0ABR3WBC7_9PEZI